MDTQHFSLIQISNEYLFLLVSVVAIAVIAYVIHHLGKINTNELSIHLVLYNRDKSIAFHLLQFRNFPISQVSYNNTSIIKYAKILQHKIHPKLQLKYNNNTILLNKLNIKLPDILHVPFLQRNNINSIVLSRDFNAKLIVRNNSSIIGLYGIDKNPSFQIPQIKSYGQNIYYKWYSNNNSKKYENNSKLEEKIDIENITQNQQKTHKDSFSDFEKPNKDITSQSMDFSDSE